MFQYNEREPGTIRIGAFDPFSPIMTETPGRIAVLSFLVKCDECRNGDRSDIIILHPADDFSEMRIQNGAFTYHENKRRFSFR